MRVRVTVRDGRGGGTDAVLECSGEDLVEDLLDQVRRNVGAVGAAVVDGVVPAPGQQVAQSALRDGALVEFGGAVRRPDAGSGFLELRVVSGASAGLRATLRPGVPLVVGRGGDADLTLDDPDASRLHARFEVSAEGVVVSDVGSLNGTWVSGQWLDGPATLGPGVVVQLGGTRLQLEAADDRRAAVHRLPTGEHLLGQHYALKEAWAAPTVALPEPVRPRARQPFPLLAVLLPLVAGVALGAALRQPYFLLFALLSPVTVIANQLADRRGGRRDERMARETYEWQLREARIQIDQAVDDEDARLRASSPAPAEVIRIATEPRIELWQRRPEHEDWLLLRLGTADRPASVVLTGERPEELPVPVVRKAPAGVDLDTVGVLGLAGPPGSLQSTLSWVLLQCAALHGPRDLPIAMLAPGAGRAELAWTRWLPHAREGALDRLAWREDDVDALARTLVEEMDARLYASSVQAGSWPRLLVVLADVARLRRPALVTLVERGPAVGFRFICAEADPRLLPAGTRAVAVVDGDRTRLQVAGAAPIDLASDGLSDGDADRAARALAPLRTVDAGTSGGLPTSLRYADLAGPSDPARIRAGWRGPERTAVTIGVDADGPVLLDLVGEGPHALLAGTTGAGKSELLRTLLGALAHANPPDRLNFVFIDFKGGVTFKDLRRLPHTVDMVSNLDARLARRTLDSLRAELTHRQRRIAEARVDDLAEYQRRAAGDPALRPVPRLVIVIDEFAEMKEQLPELVDGLLGVARLGRSLGVHLILGTQRPAGIVSEQILANTDLRICLRVTDSGDSASVVQAPDAARLPKAVPGRAYVRSANGSLRLIQTARITAPVDSDTRRAVTVLRWDERPPAPAEPRDGGRTDLEVLVDAVRDAAAGVAEPPYRPTLPPLPTVLSLDELPPAGRHQLVLGMRDDPEWQAQPPLVIPLGSGHVAVAGSPGSGRTSAARAAIVGLTRAAGPDELHLHVVDGGSALLAADRFPHCGAVVRGDERERVARLFDRLGDLVRDRRELLATLGVASVAELWSRGAPQAPPQVLLVLDGWRTRDDTAGTELQESLHWLLDNGASAGVTVLLAADDAVLRSGRLTSRFTHRLVLRLANPSDAGYFDLPTRSMDAGMPAGRALLAPGAAEVQIPLLVSDPSGAAQATAMTAAADEATARWAPPRPDRRPIRVDALPRRITLTAAADLPPVGPVSGSLRGLLGVTGDELATVWLDLSDHRHVVVAGPTRSGRSTALVTLGVSLARSGVTVLLMAPRLAEAHEFAAESRVRVVTDLDITSSLGFVQPEVVLIDDADRLRLPEDTADRLADGTEFAVVVAADVASFEGYGTALHRRVGKAARAVVLLSPPGVAAADNVGVRLRRGQEFTGPPGRAYLSVDGDARLGQVPLATDRTPADADGRALGRIGGEPEQPPQVGRIGNRPG